MMRILVLMLSLAHADAKFAAGHACLANDECASGVCEGKGCDDKSPGQCVEARRICPHNRVPFCGCDGKSFNASSACPGKRYRDRGACTP
jgi:hypothetical protein